MHSTGDGLAIGNDVESAFGRELPVALGHKRHLVWTDPCCDRGHLRRRGHLDVQLRRDDLAQHLDVPIVDVPPVAAEVDRDALRAGELAEQRRRNGPRLPRPPRLAHGRDVIDVDGEAHATLTLNGLAAGALSSQALLHRVRDVVGPRPNLGRVAAFEHDAQQWLGAGVAHEEPAVIGQLRFDAGHDLCDLRHLPKVGPFPDAHVDQHLRIGGQVGSELAERSPCRA